MDPIAFEECNCTIAEDQPPYKPLPVLYLQDPMGTVLMCWEVTDEDLAEIQNTRRIWITALTFNEPFQPLNVSAEKPVIEFKRCTCLSGQPDIECPRHGDELKTKLWKVVGTDNFNRETRSDWIVATNMDYTTAKTLLDLERKKCSDSSPNWYLMRTIDQPDFIYEP